MALGEENHFFSIYSTKQLDSGIGVIREENEIKAKIIKKK
jgi:hypothetical protein